MKLLGASSLLFGTALLLNDLTAVNALKLFHRRKDFSDEAVLRRRATMSSDLDNHGDSQYYTNITLNGQSFSVLIDTGSSDLAVGSDVPGASSSGKTASVDYAIGEVKGPIELATLEFEGFSVQNQAFIRDTTGDQKTGEGIIGLGPSSSSVVQDTLGASTGNPPLDRIFLQNTSTPNYLSVYLGRSNDPTDPFPGDLTIGSLISGYENVTSQPKLSVTVVKSTNSQHWGSLLDANGIIGPDGVAINTTSKVAGTSKNTNQLRVIFDTGFTFPQVPTAVADAIYSRVPNATFKNITGNIGGVWTIPCTVELNVTFKFANVSFPIHPLDTSLSQFNEVDELGNPICLGAFQPIQQPSSTYDAILGMAFLRNAYMLINFGDFVNGLTDKVADPYIQLLPTTTDLAEAHNDFVTERLDGIDDTGSFHLLPASVQSDPTETQSGSETFADKIHPYIPYIIAGSVAAGVILLVAIGFCIRSGRKRRYQRLHEPAPVGLHHQEPPFSQYQPSRRY
ncbi:acid protease [Abortiporus biennis]|nr:acid protease [Abortiporus biennis]